MKKIVVLFIMTFVLSINVIAQIPQHYNYNNVGYSNLYPFGMTGGKQSQYLFLANDFNQPTPVPSGMQITKIYFFLTKGGTATYRNLCIKLGQAAIASLPTGSIYSGQLDTVYYRDSVRIAGVADTAWMSITLDKPFIYDTSKGLIVDVSHCGATASALYLKQTTLADNRRNNTNISGNCVFTYYGQDGGVPNFGVDVTLITGIVNNNSVPLLYSLSQNYPNPFNPVTKIRYEIPKDGFVKLIVYDMLGREIETLVDVKQTAGIYEATFDAAKYSSGVYFYSIKVNDFSDTKRMMVIK